MFGFSKKSKDKLIGIHPDLVRVVNRAIELSMVDFSVFEGMRTKERQVMLVKSGASTTMNSRHLTGHAVDLVAYVGGDLSWDWPLSYKIAEAVQAASRELNVKIVWGGVWDKLITDYRSPSAASADYAARRRAAKKRVFIDGPHFELSKAVYP